MSVNIHKYPVESESDPFSLVPPNYRFAIARQINGSMCGDPKYWVLSFGETARLIVSLLGGRSTSSRREEGQKMSLTRVYFLEAGHESASLRA